MVGGGTGTPPEANTSAVPLGASHGLSGADDIGDQLEYDGRRAVTAGAVHGGGVNPALSSRWGTAGQGLVSADQVPGIMRGEGTGEEKLPTTRSAGSLQRGDGHTGHGGAGGGGVGVGGGAGGGGYDDQMKRPLTASAVGRSGPGGGAGQEDDHVVAGARAMMQYRRNKETNPGVGVAGGGGVAPSSAQYQQQQAAGGGRWANTGSGAGAAGVGVQGAGNRNPPPRVNSAAAGTGVIRKVHHSSVALSLPHSR
jgi:hypothetical protein